MKKLLLLVLLGVFLLVPKPCPAADRQCPLIWDSVAGHDFTLTLGDQDYDVRFSGSYAGPCPMGTVEVYDNVYVAPRLVCPYRTGSNNSVVLELGEDADLILYLWQGKLVQIVIPPDAIVLEPSDADD